VNITVGKGVGVSRQKGLWRFPRLELGGEGRSRASTAAWYARNQGAEPCNPPLRRPDPWAPRPATGPSPTGSSGQSLSAASISRRACSKLLAMLCTNGFATP